MSYLFVFFIFVLCLFTKSIKNRITRFVLRCFLILWGSIFLVSIFNPYGLNSVSTKTYFFFFLGVLFFFLGALITNYFFPKEKMISVPTDFRLSKAFIYITFVYILFFLYYFSRYFIEIAKADFSMYEVRIGYSLLFRSTAESTLFDVFIYPFFLAFHLFAIICLFQKKYRFFGLLLMLVSVLFAVVGIGRLHFAFIGIDLLAFYLLFRTKKKNKHGFLSFIFIIISVALVLVLIASVTSVRSGDIDLSFGFERLGYTVVTYLVGPFRMFDMNSSLFIERNGYLFGRATIAGIDQFFFSIEAFLGLSSSTYANDIIGSFTAEYYDIGGNLFFNYAYSAFFNFYIDFDIFGICVLSLLFGFFVGIISNRLLAKKDVISSALFLFAFEAVIYSPFSFKFQSMSNTIVLVVFVLIILNQKRRASMTHQNVLTYYGR